MLASLAIAAVFAAVQAPTFTDPPRARAVRVAAAPQSTATSTKRQWRNAVPLDQFTQRDPEEGARATGGRKSASWHTDDALYVAFRAFDATTSGIVAPRATRWRRCSRRVGVMIDSWHDRRSAFEFMVTHSDAADTYWYDDSHETRSWDATWESGPGGLRGWTAELKIPFSQLRFASVPSLRFGFNAWRRISRKNEIVRSGARRRRTTVGWSRASGSSRASRRRRGSADRGLAVRGRTRVRDAAEAGTVSARGASGERSPAQTLRSGWPRGSPSSRRSIRTSGRSRPIRDGEPLRLRNLPHGAASVLRRGVGRLQVRNGAQLQCDRAALLQPGIGRAPQGTPPRTWAATCASRAKRPSSAQRSCGANDIRMASRASWLP